MKQETYYTGIRYAKSLLKQWSAVYSPKDLVHDAYLKCKGDEKWFIWAIKMTYYSMLRKKYTHIGAKLGRNGHVGERIFKSWVEISPTGSEYGDGTIDLQSFDPDTIDIQMFIDSLREIDKEVLLLRLAGYEYREIANMIDSKRPNSYLSSVLRIRKKVKQIL